MSLQITDQIVSGDIGVIIEIDTELASLDGYVIEVEFYDNTGALKKTSTAADGGAGPIGRLVTYTTVQADKDLGVHVAPGRWAHVPKLTATGVIRHGTPPVYATVVAAGT